MPELSPATRAALAAAVYRNLARLPGPLYKLAHVGATRATRVHNRDVVRSGWLEATTFRQVGQITARWLLGEVPGHPANFGPPAAETAELVSVLIAANLAGFVTDVSQPGHPDQLGYRGRTFRQRAAVTGFVDDSARGHDLITAAAEAGLLTVLHQPPRRDPLADWDAGDLGGIPVTEVDGEPYTWFGRRRDRNEIRGCYADTPAAEVLIDAWQITLVDPEWGRNDRLWAVLREWAAPTPMSWQTSPAVHPDAPPPGTITAASRHFTASAAVFDVERELVLLITHRGTGRRQFPGGHVDENQTGAEAAIREVEEETGVRATLWAPDRLEIPGGTWHPSPLMTVEFPAPADPSWNEPAHHHLDLLFVATADSTAPLVPQEDEVSAAEWLPLADVDTADVRPDVPPVAAAAWAALTGRGVRA